ncbi:hypothetical protein [Nocardioides pyridinolyticus]
MKTALAVGAALAALVAAPALAAPAPTIDVKPGQLERGEDSTVPRMAGDRTIVDGDTRIELDEPAYLLGPSGDEYVVASYPHILRVSTDGSTEQITRYGNAADPQLTGDGEDLLISRIVQRRTMIRVVDAETGDDVSRGRFSGYVGVLDAEDGRAVLTGTAPERTLWWSYRSGATRTIVKRGGGTADIGADRLATLTGDPYEGGCTVVSRLSRPRVVLWRSCEDMPIAFSPSGKKMVTVYLLSDGLGPSEIVARRTKGGRKIATYTSYYFSSTTWETEQALLTEAHTRSRVAVVRCVVADCERASAVRKSVRRP